MRIHSSLSAIALLFALGLGSCSWFRKAEPPAEQPETPQVSISGTTDTPSPATAVLIGSDETSEIDLPEGWASDRELHEEAQLQASNRVKRMYIIVLAEDKSSFPQPLTLAKHSEITRSILLGNLTDSKVTGPTEVKKIGNFNALQYEIQGKINNINVSYLHTTIETPTRFSQILAWTTPERFKTDEAELQRVIASFRERPTSDPTPISPGAVTTPQPSSPASQSPSPSTTPSQAPSPSASPS